MQKILTSVILLTALNTNAALGPIPIYLNTEYRTDSPVIGSIASTLKFDADDIKASGASTFLDFLATVPSVGLVNPQGNVPAVFLRGNEARHTLVLIDGVKVHDVSSVSGAVGIALTSIPLAQIERVEVVKGPYSSLYGSGAIGGVIQIFTKKNSNYSAINISTGSNNSKRVNFSSTQQDENGFVGFNLSKYQTNGISARTDNDEEDGIDNQSLGFKIGRNLSDKTDFLIDFLQSNNQTKYDNCFGSNDCLNKSNLDKLTLSVNHSTNNNWDAHFSLSEINQDKSLNGFAQDYKTKDLTWLNDIKLSDSLLNIGFSKIDNTNITNNQTLTSKDVFAQWQKKLSSVDVNTGVRFINHSNFGNETVYNLGIAKHFKGDIKLTGAYGTAFNAPSIFQISDADNPNILKPETSDNIEIGLEKQHYWGLSSIKIYKTNIKNLVGYVGTICSDGSAVTYPAPAYSATCPTGEQVIPDFYQNQDKLNTQGLEIAVNANITGYNIGFSHNYNDSKINDSTTQSVRRPKNTSNLTVSKQYAKFNSRMQVIKKSSSLDVGNVELNGYTLVNLSTAYDFNDNTNISLNINNAFDKDYTVVNGYNQLGRTVTVGLDYNF
ncbi:Outer membrane vitamin B12 receptor BtuB [uncultured Candidatus Thioglobus sp.]|nr:Outer membrane vitamin B12 receptor BtuB [uncultured Candidatus Thioglobus sp.]